MNIHQNISLREYNTFGIDVQAKEFVEVKSVEELSILCQAFNFSDRKMLVIGGGSNLLLTGNFDGMVIRNAIKGIEVVSENNDFLTVKAFSGEVWHEFVMWSVERGLGGIENLSLIPGCVGAAPMQNIGAYGAEIKQTCISVDAMLIESGEIRTFTKEECKFGYRESIFKNEVKGNYIITSVTFMLNKHPQLNATYGAIQQTLAARNITSPTVKDISDAVISIRQSKLPDPKVLGNSGSFFKNPEIPISQYEQIKKEYPELVAYPVGTDNMKLAAGWLIEQCGWKGKRVGNVGSHQDQALVLVNYGGATGKEIWDLAMQIQSSVKEKFGVVITPEVNII